MKKHDRKHRHQKPDNQPALSADPNALVGDVEGTTKETTDRQDSKGVDPAQLRPSSESDGSGTPGPNDTQSRLKRALGKFDRRDYHGDFLDKLRRILAGEEVFPPADCFEPMQRIYPGSMTVTVGNLKGDRVTEQLFTLQQTLSEEACHLPHPRRLLEYKGFETLQCILNTLSEQAAEILYTHIRSRLPEARFARQVWLSLGWDIVCVAINEQPRQPVDTLGGLSEEIPGVFCGCCGGHEQD